MLAETIETRCLRTLDLQGLGAVAFLFGPKHLSIHAYVNAHVIYIHTRVSLSGCILSWSGPSAPVGS